MAGVAVATPTLPVPHQRFALLSVLATTNFDLLDNHIMFWPHQLWKPSSAHVCMCVHTFTYIGTYIVHTLYSALVLFSAVLLFVSFPIFIFAIAYCSIPTSGANRNPKLRNSEFVQIPTWNLDGKGA